jgi:hypothetical protein
MRLGAGVSTPRWKVAEEKPVSWVKWPGSGMRDFRVCKRNLRASDYRDVLCMSEYLMEGRYNGDLERALVLSGSVRFRLRESSTWGLLGPRHAIAVKSFEGFHLSIGRQRARGIGIASHKEQRENRPWLS